MSPGGEDFFFTPDVARMIKELWNTPQIRQIYERQSEFQLDDSAAWLVLVCFHLSALLTPHSCPLPGLGENLDRIGRPDYLPTQQDVLLSRSGTFGWEHMALTDSKNSFNVYDVGGSRAGKRSGSTSSKVYLSLSTPSPCRTMILC